MVNNNVLQGLAQQAQLPVDDVPARLTQNEYVIPADVVVGLGNGDVNNGIEVLDNLVENIREKLQADIVKGKV